MTDIELMIKIPKAYYENLLKNCRFSSEEIPVVSLAIATGTPLPEGHGRLFDERDIVNNNYEIIGNRIFELEPVIEADKENEE